jgi:hypothetical protein
MCAIKKPVDRCAELCSRAVQLLEGQLEVVEQERDLLQQQVR